MNRRGFLGIVLAAPLAAVVNFKATCHFYGRAIPRDTTEFVVNEDVGFVGTEIMVPSTGEIMQIVSISGSTVNVRRGHNGTVARSIPCLR